MTGRAGEPADGQSSTDGGSYDHTSLGDRQLFNTGEHVLKEQNSGSMVDWSSVLIHVCYASQGASGMNSVGPVTAADLSALR